MSTSSSSFQTHQHITDLSIHQTSSSEMRGASTGARAGSAGWDLHGSSCSTCSLLLPTPLTSLMGTMCKCRQGVALQHRARRRLFQSQHNDPVVQMLWKHCHWLRIPGYIAIDFAAYSGVSSAAKESKDRFGPKPRSFLWKSLGLNDGSVPFLHSDNWSGCSLLGPKNPCFFYSHKSWERMGSSLPWVSECVTG